MKPIRFLGNSLECLRDFPEDAMHDAGYQLERVQRGLEPHDFKPMPVIGPGVQEIRIWEDSGTYRVIYTAKVEAAVYVLHAFQKKTRTTPKHHIEIARSRYKELVRLAR